MITLQTFLLLALGTGCILSLPVRNTPSNTTCSEVAIPDEVVNQLTDITEDSKGLLPLWKSAYYLADDRILASEVSCARDANSVCAYQYTHAYIQSALQSVLG